MKLKLRFIMLTLLCAVFSTAWGDNVTDILNSDVIGVSGTSYSDWSDITSYSNAVYAGNSSKNYGSIQLRANGTSGIVTTFSGGIARTITIEWNSNTVDGRTLEVYGKNEPYSNASELYGSSEEEEEEDQEAQGTLLGSIVKGEGESTTLTIVGDYEYIGLRSANRALILTSITIVWETDQTLSKVYTPTFTPASGTTFIEPLEVSISCATEDATIYYTTDGSDPTTEGQEYYGPFTIFETTEVKAIAVKDGLENSEIATAIYTFMAEVQEEDGIFDFSHNLSYGSGLTPSSNNYDYIEEPVTWTAGNVTLVTDGKYRYWQRNSGMGQLRIGYDNNSTMTFSVPENMVITRIEFYSGILHFIPDVGALTYKTWEGKSQTVVFTVTETTEISTVTIYYEEFDGEKLDPQLSVGYEEDNNVDLYNDTAILDLSTQSNGEITFFYDQEDIVEIFYDENVRKYIVSRCDDDYEGRINVTAEQAETDTYYPASVSFSVTVHKKSQWMLTDLAELTSDDVFVIVGTNADGSYAMSNDNGTDYAPTAVEVTISTDGMELINNVADNICWNVNSEDGNYKFSPNGVSWKWLYTFHNNNGVRVGTKGDNNEFILTDENYLYNTSTNRYIGIYNSQDWRCYETINNNIKDQTFAFYKKVFEPEEIEVTFAKKAEGYSTLYYGTTALNIPEGVKAYTYKVDDNGKAVETEYDNIIPKGSAVIVELVDKSLVADGNYTVSFTTAAIAGTAHADNMLYGFDEDGQKTVGPDSEKDYYFYKLSLNKTDEKGSIGFYWNNSEGSWFYMPAHKAYLAVEKTDNAVSAFSFDGMGTGINGIFANGLPADGVYTLTGIRVNSDRLQKGIYIVNGKKVVIK